MAESQYDGTDALLAELARLAERQPQDDEPVLTLSYVARSDLGADHRWEVNLNIGPNLQPAYWTGPLPQTVLREAIRDMTEYLADVPGFLRRLNEQSGGPA